MRTFNDLVRDQIAQIDCSIKDTSADSKSVYVEWWQDGYGKVKLKNTSGSGSTVYRTDTRENGDGAFGTLRWRVCRDVSLSPDNCSTTVVHTTS